MNSNTRADFGSGSTLRRDAGMVLNSIVKTLGTLCICLVATFANSGRSLAINGSGPEGVTSSPRQLPSGQAVTVPVTKGVRSDDFRASGPKVKVKWAAGKLSLEVDGAPLSEVLQDVSGETGIEVIGADGLSSLVFAHFVGKDLVQALKELLSGVDSSIAVAALGSGSVRVVRVVIISAGAGSGGATSRGKAEMMAPPTPAPAPIEGTLAAVEPAAGTVPDAVHGEDLAAVIDGAGTLAQDSQQENQPAAAEAATAGALGAQQESQQAATDTTATSAPDASLEESPIPVATGDAPTAPDPAQQERQLAAVEAAAASGDQEALRNDLQNVDPAVQSAAFHALATQAPGTAVDDLVGDVNDPSQANRLQALQLLAQSSQAGDDTIMTALQDALKDPDPSLVAYAIQALAARGGADAMAALSEAFQSADVSTKLTIIDSVANVQGGRSLISEATSDADATVSSTAATLLKQLGP